jgi:hypothetical protein
MKTNGGILGPSHNLNMAENGRIVTSNAILDGEDDPLS